LQVSVPAVQKRVGSLERSLGLTLLERGARGVRLTASGSEYLDRCRALLSEVEELGHTERLLKGTGGRPNGLLAVAAHPQLAHHILLPALPKFHALYPDIEIDFRTVNRMEDADAQAADVLLLHGWPEVPSEYVHRNLNGGRSCIMAAPSYWADHGIPQHPSDLANHTCLLIRNPAGILLDLWEFKRSDQMVQVSVRGWMSSNAREAALDLVLGGHGVGRFTELTTRGPVQAGRLVPVLLDWELQGGPPINLVYKGSTRRTPRMRAFIDFTLKCLSDLDVATVANFPATDSERPAWHQRGYGRASSTLRKSR
jgi:LysR family transcriptional regulator, regulator for bpeEF and oprC